MTSVLRSGRDGLACLWRPGIVPRNETLCPFNLFQTFPNYHLTHLNSLSLLSLFMFVPVQAPVKNLQSNAKHRFDTNGAIEFKPRKPLRTVSP